MKNNKGRRKTFPYRFRLIGMPIAVTFAKKGVKDVDFDFNHAKIDLYKQGIDLTSDIIAKLF